MLGEARLDQGAQAAGLGSVARLQVAFHRPGRPACRRLAVDESDMPQPCTQILKIGAAEDVGDGKDHLDAPGSRSAGASL